MKNTNRKYSVAHRSLQLLPQTKAEALKGERRHSASNPPLVFHEGMLSEFTTSLLSG
jgi:hypothetical protein